MKRRYRGQDAGVSPVIGEVLMVAIAVIMAAIIYVMLAGSFSEPEEEKLTVIATMPEMEQQLRGGTPTKVWDATIPVAKVTPKEKKVLWSETHIVVKSTSGSLLHLSIVPAQDAPGSYDTNDTDGISPQFWFIEMESGDDQVDPGDAFKITGVPKDWEGANVVITRAGERVLDINLPANFE